MANNFCLRCGARLAEGAHFCPNCGAKVGGYDDGGQNAEPAGTVQPQLDDNWNEETDFSQKYFSFKGRLHRKPYLCRTFIIQFIITAVAFICGGDDSAVTLVANVLAAAFCITLTVRRLHDLGRGGWLMLVALIPLIGFFFNLYLLFAKGTDGPNDYGPDPLQFGGYSTL